MSDFDKEAERERLREKYEREQEKRESTERMSELLLKGATMTDSHCPNCSDPIFRYEGDEFCPTCQQMVETGQDGETAESAAAESDAAAEAEVTQDEKAGAAESASGQESADAAGAAASDQSPANVGAPANVETNQPTGPAAADRNGATAQDAAAADEGAAGAAHVPGGETQSTQPQTGTPNAVQNADAGAQRTTPQPRPASGASDATDDAIAAARDSLAQTLLTQARQAQQCENPGQARDHLAAAREAAETLSALSSY